MCILWTKVQIPCIVPEGCVYKPSDIKHFGDIVSWHGNKTNCSFSEKKIFFSFCKTNFQSHRGSDRYTLETGGQDLFIIRRLASDVNTDHYDVDVSLRSVGQSVPIQTAMLCSRLLILSIFAAVSGQRKFGPLHAFLNLPEVSQILNVTENTSLDVWGCQAFCENVSCVNGGTCQSWDVCRGNCICLPGFSGQRCEILVDTMGTDALGLPTTVADPLVVPAEVPSTEIADPLRQTGVDPVQQLFLMKNYLRASFTDN